MSTFRTMTVECHCGCGRAITGLRRRANNVTAGRVAQDLEVLGGALGRSEAGCRGVEVGSVLAEGRSILGSLTGHIHGGDRRGIDRSATLRWLRTAKELRRQLVVDSPVGRWLPAERDTDLIANAGVRASGVIVAVKRVGGNEHVATLRLDIEVFARDGDFVVLTREASIPVLEAPRVGDVVEVSYDASERSRFVYRPTIDD